MPERPSRATQCRKNALPFIHGNENLGKNFILGFAMPDLATSHSGTEHGVAAAAAHHVGADIRALRRSRGITLADLAGDLDRSVGWLSQVETGKTEPAIADLRVISSIFEIPISFFFRNEQIFEEDRGVVVRAAARAGLGSKRAGLTEELLSPHLSGDFEMIRSVFEPAASSGWIEARPTHEGGYLIAGRLDLTIGERRFHLSAGDSFQFQNERYCWTNPASRVAEAIWIVSPPIY